MLAIGKNLRLLIEWSPLLSLLSDVAAATDREERVLAIANSARWLARRTETDIDDELVDRLEALLTSEEFQDLADYLVSLASRARLEG
jgi:hypothetical protein